jgi:membrane protease YdiL (CAAX protease family)
MPPPSPDSLSPAARTRPRPWAASELLAWAAIVLAVLVMVVSVIQNRAAAAAHGPVDNKMQMMLSSRYAVGLKTMLEHLGRAGGTTGGTDEKAVEGLLDGVEENARTPEDRLRAAVLRGEMQGPDAALDRLGKLEETSPGVGDDVATVRRLYAGKTIDPPAWERFHDRYGWFADLAATRGKPDTDPARAAVVDAGVRTMGGVILIVLLVLGAGLLGLVLLIIGLVRLKMGKLRLAFDRDMPLPGDRRAYAQAFAIFIGSFVGAAVLIRTASAAEWFTPTVASVLGVAAMLVAVTAGATWPLFMGQRWSEWRAVNGIHAGKGLAREVFGGIVGYLAGFPILVLGALVTLLLVRVTGAEASHPVIRQLGGGWASWLLVFVMASVWAPITEELMFRGSLFAHLRERFGWWISAPIVALIFALIHPQGWAAVPALAAIAVVFAGIREWRGSIVGPMVAHGMHNAVAVIVATMMLT